MTCKVARAEPLQLVELLFADQTTPDDTQEGLPVDPAVECLRKWNSKIFGALELLAQTLEDAQLTEGPKIVLPQPPGFMLEVRGAILGARRRELAQRYGPGCI